MNQLKPYFYHSSPNGGSAIGLVVLDKIKFENDLIHLWLVNKTSERSGEIWVDVKTRKVVKAMEDGDITFPREKETEKQATE
ncbi:MAG: hypothetical protein P8M30_13245 [Planctomycetaceae bacterium]|nr:hypothetical protein [Planctomycetaceae bacterium]